MPYKILDTADVALQDQTTNPLEWYASRKITETNLSAPIAVTDEGDYYQVTPTTTVTLDDVTGIAVGLHLELWEGYLQFQGEIIAVSGNDVTLSFPIEFPFTTSADAFIVDVDMNKDFTGTGIGEQVYSFKPGDAFVGDWHITRLIVNMLHTEESDSSLYGGISELTNGVAFCGNGTQFPEETGLDKNLKLAYCLFNIKKNSDYKSIAFDVSYDPKSGNPSAGTLYGTNVRKTFNGQDKSGVVIPVRKARGEYSRVILRDDLSGLALHRIRVIGHLVEV